MKVATYLGSLVQLWGERNTANKYPWHVRGVLAVDGPHWVCHSPWQLVFPVPTLLRLQDALKVHCPKWALSFKHFPCLSCSGSWELHRDTDPDGLCVLCPSQVREVQATRCLASILSHISHASYRPLPQSQPLGFLVAQ